MDSRFIDSTKQQLLESRMLSTSSSYNNVNTNSNSQESNSSNQKFEANVETELTININSVSNLFSDESTTINDNSTSSTCLINDANNSTTDCIIETPINNNNDKMIINNSQVEIDPFSSPNRQQSKGKRRNTNKFESERSKKFCYRNEKRIDEIFKTQIPNVLQQQQPLSPPPKNCGSDGSIDITHEIHPVVTPKNNKSNKILKTFKKPSMKKDAVNSDQSNHPDQNNDNCKHPTNYNDVSFNNDSDVVINSLQVKLLHLEQKIEEADKEIEQYRNDRKKSREERIKTLIEQNEIERQYAMELVHENKLKIGKFQKFSQGAYFEDKWYEGLEYKAIEKKRKNLEKRRDENDKLRKMLNKCKSASEKLKQNTQKTYPEINPRKQMKLKEICDIRRSHINDEEKDLQAEIERLDRKRNLHIREIKRTDNEESSRFRDYPILNDRYLILSLLGKGGFSEVHKGYDLDQLCFVACKIHELNPRWSQDKKDSYIKHALREISIHKSLHHECIVRVHDVFNIDNDAFCTVLEYCEGNDLDFYLKQNKCIPEREAKSLIYQLVDALRYLNDRKNPIIHYDLKPGNILLCDYPEIKITDFGLSKIFPDDHHNPDGMELTSQGAGTYWYLPPECFVINNGPPKISNKVDVWSVGVIFYQCLYGKKPFGNNMTQTDILHNNTILQAKDIHFPAGPKISDATKDFIRKCCTYSKELRPNVFQIHEDDYWK